MFKPQEEAVNAGCLLWREVEQHTTQRLTLEKTCLLMCLYCIKKNLREEYDFVF